MGGVEHLNGFQNHFDDVLIGVPLGRQLRVSVENEDVHGRGLLVGRRGGFNFYGPSHKNSKGNFYDPLIEMTDLHIRKPSEKCSDEKFKYLEKKVKLPWKVRRLISGDCVFYHTKTFEETTNIENTKKCGNMGCVISGGRRATRRKHKTRKRRANKN